MPLEMPVMATISPMVYLLKAIATLNFSPSVSTIGLLITLN